MKSVISLLKPVVGQAQSPRLVNADQGWVGLFENILKSINLNILGVLVCLLFFFFKEGKASSCPYFLLKDEKLSNKLQSQSTYQGKNVRMFVN